MLIKTPSRFAPGIGKTDAFMGADGDQHRLKALVEQIVQVFDPRGSDAGQRPDR